MKLRSLDPAWNHFQRKRLGFTSNKLEGNTFTEAEVDFFLSTGCTVHGKTIREHCEIQSHDAAFTHVIDSLKEPLSTEYIRKVHKFCMPPQLKDSDPIPGQFKTQQNFVWVKDSAANEVYAQSFVQPSDVPSQLSDLIRWSAEHEKKIPMLALISVFHYNFVRIHPFPDTNGRTVRLLMAYFLLRNNYQLIIIEPAERSDYLSALSAADRQSDLTALWDYFAHCLVRTYEDNLKFLN